MNRKTVALGIAAVAAVAAAAVVTVANGRGTSPQHDATAAYITSVDTIQQQLREGPFTAPLRRLDVHLDPW